MTLADWFVDALRFVGVIETPLEVRDDQEGGFVLTVKARCGSFELCYSRGQVLGMTMGGLIERIRGDIVVVLRERRPVDLIDREVSCEDSQVHQGG